MTHHPPFDLQPLEASPAGPVLAFLARWEPPVALVGGCVRDLMLARTTRDLDLTVQHGGLALATALADHFGGAFYAMDAARDTGRALLDLDGAGSLVVDVAAWRAETLDGDLRLRDFTINAMAVVLGEAGPQLVDPVNGRRDLQSRLIRAASDSALADDPLRVLRAVRLLAELAPLGFRLDEDTERQIRHFAPLLSEVSIERVRDELVRIFATSRPGDWMVALDSLSLLDIVLPEMTSLHGVSQSPPHTRDVFNHTMCVMDHVQELAAWIAGDDEALAGLSLPWVADSLSKTPELRRAELAGHLAQGEGAQLRSRGQMLVWAALAHDWGKAATARLEQDDDGASRWRFLGHPDVGAELAVEALRRLRFNEAETRRVALIVRHHMRPLTLAASGLPSRRATYRYFRDLGDAGVDVALLSLADVQGTYGETLTPAIWQTALDTAVALLDSYFDARQDVIAPPPLVDGNDLMTHLHLAPGRQIGTLLDAIAEARAAGDIETREQALSLAAELATHPVASNGRG
ncbi:MAG: HD domain-containing protein [Caldilineales bacterium]